MVNGAAKSQWWDSLHCGRLFVETIGRPNDGPTVGPVIERATASFQYALTTRAGTECIAHALQALTDADPSATVLSIDGIGAFDLVSRQSMLEGLQRVDSGDSALPFVSQFYGSPSS